MTKDSHIAAEDAMNDAAKHAIKARRYAIISIICPSLAIIIVLARTILS